MRLTSTGSRLQERRRRRAWAKRFHGPPPKLATDLADGVVRALTAPGDHGELRATATAFGVMRAEQGHAIGSLLDDVAALRMLAHQGHDGPAANALVDELLNAAATGYVDQLTSMLQSRATRDPLTGLPNRAAFIEVLGHELAAAARSQPPALLLLDLDRFKDVNDTYGHLAGDQVLRGVARLLSSTGRSSDVACRLGGDEFAVVLPHTTQRQAMNAGRRLLAASRHDPALCSATRRVTLSAGLGWLPAPASIEQLVAVADAALYRVKARGGDGVEASRPDDERAGPGRPAEPG